MPLPVRRAPPASGQEPSFHLPKKSLGISNFGYRRHDNISGLQFFEAATSGGFNCYVYVVQASPEY
jgi:hypothetical protein